MVAIKRLAPADPCNTARARSQLEAEALVLADLRHPHIVRILDVVDDGDGLAIVMQLAPGGSLAERLAAEHALSPAETISIVAPVADALAATHRRGLVHGDVKPANILFSRRGQPLLADFGVARRIGPLDVDSCPITGTAPYLDPALLDGADGHPSPANDVYALGVVCYEALAGVAPYEGPDEAVLCSAALGRHQSLTELAWIPGPVAQVVERTIARRPADRPASMEELAALLRASVATSTPLAASGVAGPRGPHRPRGRHGTREFGPRPPAPPAARSAPRKRSHRVLLAVAVCGALAVTGAFVGYTHAGSDRTSAVRRRRCTRRPTVTHHSAPGVRRFEVDVDGDGCAVPATWDGRVLVVGSSPPGGAPDYYEIGRPGDVLLFGDWDCDLAKSPALYRPSAGEVLYVNSFGGRVGARAYADRIERGLARDGIARVVVNHGRCDEVRVAPPT